MTARAAQILARAIKVFGSCRTEAQRESARRYWSLAVRAILKERIHGHK